MLEGNSYWPWESFIPFGVCMQSKIQVENAVLSICLGSHRQQYKGYGLVCFLFLRKTCKAVKYLCLVPPPGGNARPMLCHEPRKLKAASESAWVLSLVWFGVAIWHKAVNSWPGGCKFICCHWQGRRHWECYFPKAWCCCLVVWGKWSQVNLSRLCGALFERWTS